MPGGSKPGERRGGRRPGTPNKLTVETREVFLAIMEKLAPKLEAALSATLETDPARGAELLLKLSERFIPVLSRQQVEVATENPITLRDLLMQAKAQEDRTGSAT